MKILSHSTVFKRLPLEMDGYQRLIFDAIRITFEMIEYDYELLENELFDLSEKGAKKEHTSRIFSHAWGIIDHTSRLIRLFKKLPSDSGYKVLEKILIVNQFRNTIQHLDERIDESMIENTNPFYGILSWFHKNLISEEITPMILISGLTWGFNAKTIFPDTSICSKEINDIRLQTVNKKETIIINLSELIHDLQDIADQNEVKLNSFFENQGWKLCDWSKRQDILISLKSEEKK